jgi:hypothetical protein
MQRLPKKELPDPVLKPEPRKAPDQSQGKMWSMPILRMWAKNNFVEDIS